MRLPALLACLALLPLLCPAPARADTKGEQIRLPESLSLSPDGQTLVVSWRGDLWRMPASGGAATRLTSQPSNEVRPFISPDGTQVAFLSNRSGTEQVHVMPIDGGTPTQVTLHTEGSRLYGWFPDGKSLLIRTRRDHDWRAADRFFRKPLSLEARPELIFNAECRVGAVSPDGRYVAFVREGMAWWRKGYRGKRASQLWLYDMQTGKYRQLSEGDHGELWPMWGAGGALYYVSEEDGTWNIWTRDLESGKRRQITHHKDDGVSFPSISADGSTLAYRRLFDIYRVDAGGEEAPQRVEAYYDGDATLERTEHATLTRATGVAFSKDAREIAFVAGGDIWVMDTELREPRQITNTPQEERDPVFSSDYESLYFLSDAAGSTDVWQIHRADSDKYWWQNDHFRAERLTQDEAVESDLTLTPDGKRLAFLRERGDLWTMALDGTDRRKLVDSWSGLQFSFSPDGKWVAYSKCDDDFNWDIWIAPVDGSKEAVNVSVHPDNDMNPAWSPDGKTLAFVGSRWNDDSDVCYVPLRKRDAEEDKRARTLKRALKKMKGRKKKGSAPGKKKPAARVAEKSKDTPAPASPPARGPLVGIWRGSLSGPEPIPEDGLGLTLTITKKKDGSYACSVDVVGQFEGAAGDLTFAVDTGKTTFSAPTPLGALTGAGSVRGERMEGTWEIEGLMKGTFEANREEAAAAAKPAESAPDSKKGEAANPGEKAKSKKPKQKKGAEPVEIDFEDLTERVRRIRVANSNESGLLWSPDSKKLAFRATLKGTHGLYTVSFPDKLSPKLLTTTRGSSPVWLKEGNQIAWMVGGVPATMSSSGKAKSFAFRVRQTVDLPALHGAAFDLAWRTMRDRYYDPELGNRNWDAVRAKYAPMAAQCVSRKELELVVNLMLGELNGSHLGFRARGRTWSKSGWRDVTGHLGLRFDAAYEGAGLKVLDVVRGTPAHADRHRIKPGEIIISIDGERVGPDTNLALLLTGDPARQVSLEVKNEKGESRQLSMRPTSYATVRRNLYEHWLEDMRERVTRESEGRLGYLHVRGMNWPSFLRFEEELYKVGHGKDGLIIDVRDNGGGFTTDHLLTCLTQPRHAITRPRGGGQGYPHDRMVYAPWHKPVVILCNQNSFSNAEIFAHAIKTLKRGQVVGVTTAGGVISTGGAAIMGLGSLRLPFRGWYLLNDGEDMELNGCVPHHVLWPQAADFAEGIDRQLDKAIEVGLSEIKDYQNQPRPKLRPASAR